MHASAPKPEQNALQAACSEIVRLRTENEGLRKELKLKLKQGARGAPGELEHDGFRVKAIQSFIERGILVESLAEFGPLACESITDLLGCGVGILVYCGGSASNEFLFQSGLGEISSEDLLDLRAWTKQWCRPVPGAVDCEVVPPPKSLGLTGPFLVQPIVDGWGTRQGLIFACNKSGKRDKSGKEFPAARALFLAFAKELGVLMLSLKRHLTIIEQIDTIRISEERLSTALASNNVGLWDWDLVTGRIYYSPQWKCQLGLESDELSDSPDEWINRIHPDDWDHAVKVVQTCCMSIESSFELTVRMHRKDGSWIWINSRGHHVSTHDGMVRRMIGTQIDVTGYKSLENKLLKSEKKQRLAKELAERENRAKSSFLAAVSHEIRTPLNGILGVFQMLHMTRELDRAKLENLVDMGEQSAKWMLRVIGESLDIARIESGKLELKPEIVDLDALLEELKSLKSKRATHLGLDLRWQVAADVPRRILVDALRLRQILANLIINSLKFTDQGFVALDVTVGGQNKDGKYRLCFSVSDSGIGFSKEFGRMIFEPFAQGAESKVPRDPGIGMGLAITKELVGLMGGTIKASSQSGVGSTFAVTLPVMNMSEEIAECEIPPVQVLPSFRGKILIVDDDQISGEIGQLMLAELGFQVDLAADGRQGLELASSTYYDLILMDCWMPLMGGIEATHQLRDSAEALSRNVPIIALTANARLSDVAECRAAGMNDFMAKPLLLDNLIEKLTLHLPFDGPVDISA